MPCFRPLTGYRSRVVNPATRKRSIVFNIREGFHDLPVQLPCGQCIGCRLEHSRQWAIRAVHEAACYDSNVFLTLTYADEHLPPDRSIDLNAPVLFMKRLRKEYGSGIRSYGCAEYGEKFGRPHYHLCLFNHDFPDKYPWKVSPGGHQTYRSPKLEELWPFGHSEFGSLTFESAAYVARYVTKKVTGERANKHYDGRTPEKPVCVSRRPGLGRPWFEKNQADVYPSDHVIMRGREMRPPKYYDRIFEVSYPTDFLQIKRKRKRLACKNTVDNEFYRLITREQVQTLKFKQLKRGYENE